MICFRFTEKYIVAIDLFDESEVDLSFMKFLAKIVIHFLFMTFKTLEMLIIILANYIILKYYTMPKIMNGSV